MDLLVPSRSGAEGVMRSATTPTLRLCPLSHTLLYASLMCPLVWDSVFDSLRTGSDKARISWCLSRCGRGGCHANCYYSYAAALSAMAHPDGMLP